MRLIVSAKPHDDESEILTQLKEKFNKTTHLITCLDESLIDHVVFKQCMGFCRQNYTLETHSMPADEFVELFCENLDILRPHSFIASQQSTFYKDCKLKLVPGEMLVTADFSENYSFVLQDAAQGFHWNNSQATLHPFVCVLR